MFIRQMYQSDEIVWGEYDLYFLPRKTVRLGRLSVIGLNSGYVDIDYYSVDGFYKGILIDEDGFMIDMDDMSFSNYNLLDVPATPIHIHEKQRHNYSNYLTCDTI